MTPPEDDTLTAFMKALFEAGFDVQVILGKGFDFAVRRLPGMDIGEAWLAASGAVKEVARELCIDRESQFRAYKEARDELRYRRM